MYVKRSLFLLHKTLLCFNVVRNVHVIAFITVQTLVTFLKGVCQLDAAGYHTLI